MIEIRIPKEIRQYKEKAIFGLTWRQIFSLILTAGINVPLYMFLTPILGNDISSWLVIFTATPAMMLGFWEPYGMNFEDYLKAVVASMFIYPEKRLYKTENLYEILMGEKEPAANRNSGISKLVNTIIDDFHEKAQKKAHYAAGDTEPIDEYNQCENKETNESDTTETVSAELPTQSMTEKKKDQPASRPIIIHGLISIAVFSISSGAGATTMATRMAEYLARYGKTAAVAVDGKIDLSFVKGKANYFIVDGTNLSSVMYELSRDKYQFVVTDYGAPFDVDNTGQVNYSTLPKMRDLLSEFFRSHYKVGMGLSSPWHLDKFKFFMDGEMFADKIMDGSYFFLFDKDVKSLRFRYGFKQIYSRADLDMYQFLSIVMPDIFKM